MKKTAALTRRMLVGVALTLTACLALSGCGGKDGNNGKTADNSADYLGYWEFSGYDNGADKWPQAFIDLLYGDDKMIVNYREDGTCEVDVVGEVHDGT